MKRKIKFRVGNKWEICSLYAIKYKDDWTFILIWDEISSETVNIDDCNLMQYTWLKDKNWKKIYEWDIVKVWDYEWLEIVFQDGRFIPLLWEDDEYEDDWTRETLEVIWNIYENKELLTN